LGDVEPVTVAAAPEPVHAPNGMMLFAKNVALFAPTLIGLAYANCNALRRSRHAGMVSFKALKNHNAAHKAACSLRLSGCSSSPPLHRAAY